MSIGQQSGWNVIHDRCSSAFNVFVFGFENGLFGEKNNSWLGFILSVGPEVFVSTSILKYEKNGQTTAPKMGVEICHRTGAIGRGLPSLSFW